MNITDINNQIKNKAIEARIEDMCNMFPGKVVFTTSFGMEDQVITDIIYSNNLPVKVATLDTGRMFEETYKVFSRTRERYGKKIEVYYPDTKAVEKLMTTKGPFSFYESAENRIECCSIRKVEPLRRALKGYKCWITGIRQEQSAERRHMQEIEWDPTHNLYKMSPLYEWTLDEVEKYIKTNNVPYNLLYDKGFASIGCAPCTRAIRPGDDFRSGRWWWEHNSAKECGLHI
jgi:phosphoadenosine phosphosulfate reductase